MFRELPLRNISNKHVIFTKTTWYKSDGFFIATNYQIICEETMVLLNNYE